MDLTFTPDERAFLACLDCFLDNGKHTADYVSRVIGRTLGETCNFLRQHVAEGTLRRSGVSCLLYELVP